VKELIEYIARSLADDPSQVQVRLGHGTGMKTVVELRVAREYMGRIIGKNGRVANAIRVLLRVAAQRDGKQVTLEVVEPR
jgi:hypothetical protein